MAYIVVVKAEGSANAGEIFRGDDPVELFGRLRRKFKGRKKPSWFGKATDRFIMARYHVDLSAQQIAEQLSLRSSPPATVTKNMVISRYHTLRKRGTTLRG